MAVAYRNGVSVANGNGTSCVLSTYPTGYLADDILVAALYKENVAAITVPSGWTEKTRENQTDHEFVIYWKRAVTTEPTATWSWTGNVWRGMVAWAYSGVKTTGDPFEAFDGDIGGPSGTMTAPTITTLTANAMRLMLVSCFEGGTWTAGSSMTLRTTSAIIAAQDLVQAAAGATGTATMTHGVSTGRWTAIQLALTDASAAAAATSYPFRSSLRIPHLIGR